MAYFATYRQSRNFQSLEDIAPVNFFERELTPSSSARFAALNGMQHNRGTESSRTHVVNFADGGKPILVKTKTGSEKELVEAVLARRREFGHRSPIFDLKTAVDLKGMDLSGVTFKGKTPANLEGANLKGATLLTSGATTATRANLQGATLSGDFSGSVLAGANMQGVKTLDQVNLSNAKMRGVDLRGATLTGNLSGAQAQGAKLEGAELSGTAQGLNIAGATGAFKLTHIDARHANLTGAQVSIIATNAKMDDIKAAGAHMDITMDDASTITPDSFAGSKISLQSPHAKAIVMPHSQSQDGHTLKAAGLKADVKTSLQIAQAPELAIKAKKNNPHVPMGFYQRAMYLHAYAAPSPT